MLVNPQLRKPDETLQMLFDMMSENNFVGIDGYKQIQEGIFECAHFNFNEYLGDLDFDHHYPFSGCYGVCDNYKQVVRKFKKILQDPEKKFVISITKIEKSKQPSEGGWRWHKWGAYIGTKKPKNEYLFDEDDSIQIVYVYHIYELYNF